MIVTLRGGTIELYDGDRVTDRLYVDGGFAEVTPERCTVLANHAIPVAEINKTEADQKLTEAEQAYEAADKRDTGVEDAALDRVQAARAMVEAAG
jgi:F-type H+-transporting ATPase subunit epsilon